ncbi:translocating chain-associated membrane 1-like 1 [Labeo rohita]|uniref:Translocating chain-associated membrane protein n=1 Tax=Labeo rohita TaxID=84645 RepID=A0A498N0R2_LABRO|nr:translocating chain-associated membrane 1-like 1 [Labeo rohita]
MGFRKKNKSPPVLSHEFVIQNHADMVSCVAMIILLGLMFEVTAKFAIMFITVQYNVTQSLDAGGFISCGNVIVCYDEMKCQDITDAEDKPEPVNYYKYGPKDIATVFFYLLIAIILHALIQDFQVKFFYICQIAYWFHALPELYFQKVRKEDIPRQLYYICLYIFHITGAYVLNLHRLGLVLLVPHYLVELLFHASRLFYFSDENKQKGFTLWALLFVITRLLTLTVSVLTFGFGLSRTDNQGFSLAEGNFNVLTIRMTCLSAICLTQAWMMWKFINFQLKKWREQSQIQASKKKAVSPKSRPSKKESRGGSVNGVMKPDDKTSPRARKSKASPSVLYATMKLSEKLQYKEAEVAKDCYTTLSF